MEATVRDLQYAARNLRRSRAFTALVVIILALGIGAGVAVFSLVKAVLLDPLEFPDADRLVLVRETTLRGVNSISYPNFEDWHRAQSSFERLAAYAARTMTLDGVGDPAQLQAVRVTGEFFSALGVDASIGRALGTEDDRLEAEPVVVLGHGLWQDRFGGDAAVIGRSLRLDHRQFTVVGVAPEGFNHPFFAPGRRVDLWVPMELFVEEWNLWHRADHPGIYGVARLREDTSLAVAQADKNGIARALETEYPDTNSGAGVELLPLKGHVVGDARPALVVLVSAVGFMLSIVCANVASLLLVRATGRRRELAVRSAIGASRARLVRLLVGESLLLSLGGGLVGVMLADGALGLVAAAGAGGLPRVGTAGIDPQVLAFALSLTLLVGMFAGAIPGLQLSRLNVRDQLRGGGRATVDAGRLGARSALVVAEVVLATVLLIGAGVTGRSLVQLLRGDTGLDSSGVLTARLVATGGAYDAIESRRELFRELVTEIEAIPGVEAAGTISPLPLSGSTWGRWYHVEGAPPPDPSDIPTADFAQLSPGTLRALGIPLLRGRSFTAADTADHPPVAIVDEQFVARWWPGQDPLGKRIQMGGYGSDASWIEVVGTVRSVRNRGVAGRDREQIYLPVQQETNGDQALVLRTSGDPASLTAALREVVRRRAPGVPLFDVRTLVEYQADTAGEQPLVAALVGGFAAAGQLLAALGLYGVMAFSVASRHKEIGIRKALGARARDAVSLVLGAGLRLVAGALAAGLVGGYALSRLLASWLYGVRAGDPLVFGTVAITILLVGSLACLAPSLRAARVDPMVSLRQD